MSHLDEPNGAPGSGDPANTPAGESAGAPLEARVRELEKENATLRAELDALREKHRKDRDLLESLILSGLPADEHEMEKMLAESCSISDLIREFNAGLPGEKE